MVKQMKDIKKMTIVIKKTHATDVVMVETMIGIGMIL